LKERLRRPPRDVEHHSLKYSSPFNTWEIIASTRERTLSKYEYGDPVVDTQREVKIPTTLYTPSTNRDP